MRRNQNRSQRQAGVALLFALLTLLVLSTLAAAMIFVTETETWSSSNYRSMLQARYAAEAGAQNTLNWLLYSYTAPTSMSAFDQTKYPVQDSATHSTIVLSAMTGVTANYPTASIQTAFSSALKDASVPGVGVAASYEVTATLLSMNSSNSVSWLAGTGGAIQTWQITSQGNVAGIRNAQVQVVMNIERSSTPVFQYAVAATSNGCNAINFGGKYYTDSYNSNNGAYNSLTNSQASGGNIATNGNVTLGGAAQIKGTISALGTTVSTSACAAGLPNVTNGSGLGAAFDTGGTVTQLNTALYFPPPWSCTTAQAVANTCYPVSSPSTTAQDVSTSCASVTGCTKSATTTTILDGGKVTTAAVYTLAPGNYGNLEIDNADVVHLNAGTYNINSLNFAKDGQFVVDSGPVVLDVAGKGFTTGSVVINSGGLSGWNMCAPTVSGGVSSGVTGNPGAYGVANCGYPVPTPYNGIPANMQIVYAGTATISTTGAPLSSVIYAPNAFVDTTGAAVGMYGSIITSTFTEASKAPVHYDNALATSVMQAGPYYPVSFSWSRF